jgi:hypothetical protein
MSSLVGRNCAMFLHCNVESFSLGLYIEDAPHNVAFLRPEVKQAFAGLPGNGVLGVLQVKYHRAVFYNHGASAAAEEPF